MLKGFIYFFFLCIFCINSCNDTSQQEVKKQTDKEPTNFVKIIDATGKEVQILKKPERIIVTGTPLYTEILIDIGARNRIIAVTESPNNPPEVQNILKVGSPLQPNLEMVIKLKPDLVFGAFGEVREKLENAGIPVILAGKAPYDLIDSIEEIYSTIRTIGFIVGNTEEAEKVISESTKEILKIEKLIAASPSVTVAVLYILENQPPYVQGKGTLPDSLLKRAKGLNSFSDIDGSQQISLEALIKRDPEVIITDPSQAQFIAENSKLRVLKAVQGNKVFGIQATQWVSSRVHVTFQSLAKYLHPNVDYNK